MVVNSYFQKYINLVPDVPIQQAIEQSTTQTLTFLASITAQLI